MIEKGRHMKPCLERSERKCFVHVKVKLRMKIIFLLNVLYIPNYESYYFLSCSENCMNFDLITDKQKLFFIVTNENPSVIEKLASFVFNAIKVRENAVNPQ